MGGMSTIRPYHCVATRPLSVDENEVLETILSCSATADALDALGSFIHNALGCEVSFLWSVDPDSPPLSWPLPLRVSDFFHLMDEEDLSGQWRPFINGVHVLSIKLPYSNAAANGTYVQMTLHDCDDSLFARWWSKTFESFFWLVASNHLVRLMEYEYQQSLKEAKGVSEKKTQLLAKMSDHLGQAGSADVFLSELWNSVSVDFEVEHLDWWDAKEETRVSIGPAGSITNFHVRPRITETDCAQVSMVSQYSPSISPMHQWALCVPAFSTQGMLLGVLSLYRSSNKFSASESEVFDFVTFYLSKYMHSWMVSEKMEMMVAHRTNVLQRSLDALTKEAEERIHNEKLQSCLFQVASLASDINQWPNFYRRVHDILSEMIDVKNFYVALINDDKTWISFPYFSDKHYQQFRGRPFQKGLTEYVATQGKPTLLGPYDLEKMQQDGSFVVPSETSVPSYFWMGAPLLNNGKVFGVVAAQSYDPDMSYTMRDLDALAMIGQQMANAFIKNQSLEQLHSAYAFLEERVRERTKDLEQEINTRLQIEKRLHHEAHHDVLTGLPNRKMLMTTLSNFLEAEEKGAVLFLDLDHFKNINDTHGHDIGDAVLVEFAKRLKDNIRPNDFVARLSGDEFVVLVQEDVNKKLINKLGKRFIEDMKTPVHTACGDVTCSCSVGWFMHYPSEQSSDAVSAEDLIRKADVALYKAKKDGRQRVETYAEKKPRAPRAPKVSPPSMPVFGE